MKASADTWKALNWWGSPGKWQQPTPPNPTFRLSDFTPITSFLTAIPFSTRPYFVAASRGLAKRQHCTLERLLLSPPTLGSLLEKPQETRASFSGTCFLAFSIRPFQDTRGYQLYTTSLFPCTHQFLIICMNGDDNDRGRPSILRDLISHLILTFSSFFYNVVGKRIKEPFSLSHFDMKFPIIYHFIHLLCLESPLGD